MSGRWFQNAARGRESMAVKYSGLMYWQYGPPLPFGTQTVIASTVTPIPYGSLMRPLYQHAFALPVQRPVQRATFHRVSLSLGTHAAVGSSDSSILLPARTYTAKRP